MFGYIVRQEFRAKAVKIFFGPGSLDLVKAREPGRFNIQAGARQPGQEPRFFAAGVFIFGPDLYDHKIRLDIVSKFATHSYLYRLAKE